MLIERVVCEKVLLVVVLDDGREQRLQGLKLSQYLKLLLLELSFVASLGSISVHMHHLLFGFSMKVLELRHILLNVLVEAVSERPFDCQGNHIVGVV